MTPSCFPLIIFPRFVLCSANRFGVSLQADANAFTGRCFNQQPSARLRVGDSGAEFLSGVGSSLAGAGAARARRLLQRRARLIPRAPLYRSQCYGLNARHCPSGLRVFVARLKAPGGLVYSLSGSPGARGVNLERRAPLGCVGCAMQAFARERTIGGLTALSTATALRIHFGGDVGFWEHCGTVSVQ